MWGIPLQIVSVTIENTHDSGCANRLWTPTSYASKKSLFKCNVLVPLEFCKNVEGMINNVSKKDIGSENSVSLPCSVKSEIN